MVADEELVREVRDTLGRRIAVRGPGALDRLRLYKAAGAALASNPGWMGMATIAFSVTAIDDVPVPAPGNEAQVEMLVARLGDAGIAAVSSGLAEISAERTKVDVKN